MKNIEDKKIEMMGFGDLIIAANNEEWEQAVIVFTASSFDEYYSELSRSYEVFSDSKYFDSNMDGNSLYGYCLDGTDQGVRLDHFINNGMTVDYCYIIN